MLAVSSSDGYCSLVGFEPGELGEPLKQDKLPTCMRHTTTTASSTTSSDIDKDSLTQNNSSPSINIIVPRRIRPAPVQTPSSAIFEQTTSEEPISPPPPPQAKNDTTTGKKPRRINLVPVTKTDTDLKAQPVIHDTDSSSLTSELSATTKSSTVCESSGKAPRRIPLVTISSKPPSNNVAAGGAPSDEPMEVE